MSARENTRVIISLTWRLSFVLLAGGLLEVRAEQRNNAATPFAPAQTITDAVESTPYAGTLRVTKQIGLHNDTPIDITPPEGRNLLPIRFILNRTDDSTFFLSATRENGLFNFGAETAAKLDSSELKFSVPEFDYLGSILSIQIDLQFQDGGALSGKFVGLDEQNGTGVEGGLAMSVADPSQATWFNGIFAGNITVQTESGDSSRVDGIKDEMMRLFTFTDQAFVQVGNLAAFTFFPVSLGNKLSANARQVLPHPLFTASSPSAEGTYILLGYFVGLPAQNTLSLIIDDQVLTQIGIPDDDPLYNEVETYGFNREGDALTAQIYWKEEDLSGKPEIGEVTSQYIGALVEETFNIVKVEIVPNEIKAGEFATIEIKVVDQLNKVKEDFDGGVTIRLVENLTTQGISRLPVSQSVLLSHGVAQPVFFFTPKEPFSSDKPIDTKTVLSGKAVIDVQLENSNVPAVRREIFIKSPLDFFVDRIEIQQGIKDSDKDVTLEYKPGESKLFPALPFIAEHITAMRVFIKYNNTVPITFSKIDSLVGFSGELRITQGGSTQGPFAFTGPNSNPFFFRDSYKSNEQIAMLDGLFTFVGPEMIMNPGSYTFDAELKLDAKLDEAAREKVNNKKSFTATFEATNPLRILATVGAYVGKDFPTVDNKIWDFLKQVYPVQLSKLRYNDPNTMALSLNKGFHSIGGFLFFNVTPVLNRFNKENPSDQRDRLMVFVDASTLADICGEASGCADTWNGGNCFVGVPVSDRTIAHELGHTFGLNDTYAGTFITNGEPNPRRSGATNFGNRVEDGHIHLVPALELTSPSSPYFDIMGSSMVARWVDRLTWDYLFHKKFKMTSPGAAIASSTGFSDAFIAISGIITKTDSVALNSFLTLSQVPEISESQAGDYSLEFLNAAETSLQIFNFGLEFIMPHLGEVNAQPFSFYLPLPEGTSKVVMKKNGVEIASRTLSANPPVTQLISPTSGETISGVKTIQWTASDSDGDKLSYDILYSPDGQSQLILAVNVEETSFAWDSGLWPSSPSASITIIANDGINEARVVADRLVVDNPTRVDDKGETLPSGYALKQNHPNPFNPATQIQFDLPKPTQVTIEIYNIHGQKIRSLADEKKPAGSYIVTWDGRMDSGEQAASGVYFCRLVAGDLRQTRKMTLLR